MNTNYFQHIGMKILDDEVKKKNASSKKEKEIEQKRKNLFKNQTLKIK